MPNFYKKIFEKIDSLSKEDLANFFSFIFLEHTKLKQIFESFSFAIIIIDKNLGIKSCNKAGYRFFPELSINNFSKPITKIIKNRDILDYIINSIESQEKYCPKIISFKVNDSKIFYKLNINPIVKKGQIDGYIFMCEDATYDCHNLQNSDILFKLDKALLLTANISHEIKNPLSSVILYLDLIKKIVTSNKVDNNEIYKYASIVSDEMHRLNKIVTDFLVVVKDVDINKDVINFKDFIEKIIELYKLKFLEENIAINFSYEENLPNVQCNKDAIREVIINLINNSINALKNREDKHIDFILKKIDDKILFKIIDTGKGISKENLSKIFDPYFSTYSKGTGLGLSIVYKIIKDHKGDIEIDSKEDEGTEFSFSIPYKNFNVKLLRSNGDEK